MVIPAETGRWGHDLSANWPEENSHVKLIGNRDSWSLDRTDRVNVRGGGGGGTSHTYTEREGLCQKTERMIRAFIATRPSGVSFHRCNETRNLISTRTGLRLSDVSPSLVVKAWCRSFA